MRVNRPFADCDVAELHLADAIQPFGALLVVDGDQRVIAVSTNVADYLGETPQALLGTDASYTLADVLDLASLRASAPTIAADEPVRLHLSSAQVAGRELALAAHVRDGALVIELQTPTSDEAVMAAADVIQRLTMGLEGTDAPADAASLLMRGIAELTGFDRTMVYRFLPDWHGEVLDERLAEGMSGYRGLRFPASDIPENARRLYRLKRQRIIADATAAPVGVVGVREGMTLDLTGSELRAVHPVHLGYLGAMGVAASFSVSILARGELWGMIACHHRTPRTLGFLTRQACEMAATISSLHIANLERDAHLREVDRLRDAVDRAWLESGGDQRLDVARLLGRLREAFGADGAMASWDGAALHDGDTPAGPTAGRLAASPELAGWLDVVARDRVVEALADDPEAVRCASGVLHLPVTEHDSVTFLRREQVQNVAWAGRPRDDAPREERLGPRSSFATWREATRGRADAWSAAAIEVARELRTRLVESRERDALEQRANTDALTGLANRAAFVDQLARHLRAADGPRTALLLVDLDGFKAVNDTHGHGVGDRLLELVAGRLRHATRGADQVARLGGDEFVVLMLGVASADDLAATAERIVDQLEGPYRLGDVVADVSASVGAGLAGVDDTPERLLERVDAALYAAKDAGRNRYVIADD